MTCDASTVEVTSGPRPLVTKTATTPGAIARLRSEAAMLAAARHPGVVSVVDLEERHDPSGAVTELRMHTAFAGSRTIASLGHVSVERAAGLVAALSATVADVHRLGLVHGRITADHVVVGADGRPVLCGFGSAHRDNPADTASPSRADDVSALGDLLRDLVLQTDAQLEEVPAARRPWRRGTARQLRGPLLNLADQATADEPGHRPTAEQFAAAIRTTAPSATLHDIDADEKSSGARRPPTRRLALIATGAAALCGIGLLAAMGSPGSAPAGAPPTSPLPAESAATLPSLETTTTVAPTSTTTPDVESARGCATDTGTGSIATGEPCATSVALADGTLSVGGTRFELGLQAGVAAFGDFACECEVRAAVVDLATGDVYVFDGWATPERSRSAHAVARVPSPRKVIAEADGRGCHGLVVLDEWGLRHLIDLSPEDTP